MQPIYKNKVQKIFIGFTAKKRKEFCSNINRKLITNVRTLIRNYKKNVNRTPES